MIDYQLSNILNAALRLKKTKEGIEDFKRIVRAELEAVQLSVQAAGGGCLLLSKTMAQLFDEWYEPREEELENLEPEDIARRAWSAARLVAAQQSVQPDDYNAVPTIIKSFPMRDAYPVGHKNRRR